MPSKPVNVRVFTMDSELEFAIQPNTTGRQLFDQVVKTIELREIWFFGLLYIDSKDFPSWLKLNKKVLSQDIKKNSSQQPLVFKFRARFFPEEVSEELILNVTQNLFFLQVKESILLDEIYCPPETCVLLASYAMQAKHGDYNKNIHHPGVLNERSLPKRVTEQFRISSDEWEKRIINWWAEHQGLLKEDAMLEYLKIAQDLEMYGVNYFDIRNKRGTELNLGVDALGLNIYDKQDKLTPKIGFPWSEIRNISFNDKKFIIKPMEKKSPDFVFYAPRLRINRRILSLCMGNHELYMRRRKPESSDVQQLKALAHEQKLARRREQDRTQNESVRRKQMDQDRESMQKQAAVLEQRVQAARKEKSSHILTDSSDTESLEDQHQMAKELEDKRRQADEAELRLQQEREAAEKQRERMMATMQYEEEQKQKIVMEIERSRLLGEEKAQESQKKENEARRLQDDLRETNLKVIQAQQQSSNNFNNIHANVDEESDEEDNSISRSGRGVELNTNPYASRHEEERITATTRDVNMKQKLEALKDDLGSVQNSHKITDNDRLHEENIASGRDKYKTLKMIRQGNTKRRIDEFESM